MLQVTAASQTRYAGTTIALHWVLAVAILGSLALGLYMSDLPLSPLRTTVDPDRSTAHQPVTS